VSAAFARRLTRAGASALALVAGACFATQNDVRLLQSNMADARAAAARSDSARAAQLDRVIASLGAVTDSVRTLSARTTRGQADAAQQQYAMEQQLIQIQELTGQSQRRLQELRGQLEARGTDAPASAPGDTSRGGSAGSATPAAPAGPGPNQLYQLSLDQLRRGNAATASAGFSDLLAQYPKSDVAPAARFYYAESLAALGKKAEADSQYIMVYTNAPTSERAATALYKHALSLSLGGDVAAGRAALERIIKLYPRSDEALLARDRIEQLNKAK
jgi:TolA-binding protein